MGAGEAAAVHRRQWVPLGLGAAALILGVGYGWCGGAHRDAERAPALTDGAGGAAAASGSAAAAAEPGGSIDLTGQTAGELVSTQGSGAHALAVTAERLWWLDAAGQVGVVPVAADGGAHRLVQTAKDDHLGGDLATAEHGVYWVIKHMAQGDDVVYRARTNDDDEHGLVVEQLAAARSIDALLVNAHAVVWSGAEAWYRFDPRDGSVRSLAPLTGGVVAAGSYRDTWVWFEANAAAGGAQRLRSMAHEGGAVRTLLKGLSPAPRSQLQVMGDTLLWLEPAPDDGHGERWRSWTRTEGPQSVAAVGVVSASVVVGDALVFAELHEQAATPGEGGAASAGTKVVSVLRTLALGPAMAKVRRLGLQPGRITAMMVHQGVLWWAHDGGISRMEL